MTRKPVTKRRKTVNKEKAAVGKRFSHVRNPLVKVFATRLSNWRKAEGKTLKQMATALDLSISIICEWEHGRRFPSVDHLLDLSKHTGIPAWEFLRDSQESESKRRTR